MEDYKNTASYLTLAGVPSESPPDNGDIFFSRDPQGTWIPSEGSRIYEIEDACVTLHDRLAALIFGDLNLYHAILPGVPDFVFMAGLNSESSMTRDEFEKAVRSFKNSTNLNKLLYLYDCRKLVSGVQECSLEISSFLGEFYRFLNLEELFSAKVDVPDGVRYIASPATRTLTALMNFVFIRMHSSLDYTTKLIYEIEHMRKDFSTYPKLASSNVMFSDKKRLSVNNAQGSLFESCALINEIELYRNLVIHDGFLDDLPKVYTVIKDGSITEKFILTPDINGKQFARYNNRALFYGSESKINLRLPNLVSEFQRRQESTLKLAIANFS